MSFDLNYQSGSLLFFFIQGIVFSLLLFKKGVDHSNTASKWLSLLVLLCSLYLSIWMCGHAGWYGQDGYREFLFFFPTQQLFLIGPVIYFYTRSLINPDFSLSKKDWWHLAPAIVYFVYTLAIWVMDDFIFEEYYFYADGRDKDLAPWYQITGLASMIVYTGMSIRSYNHYRKRIFEELSYADTVVFNWMRQYLLIFLVILSIRILFLILYPNWGSFGIKWWYYLCFGALSYYIALKGYGHTIEVMSPIRYAGLQKTKETHSEESQINTKDEEKSPSQANIEVDLEEESQKIRTLMEEEELYRNPTLTLNDLAHSLSTNSKQVSLIINQGLGMNFNDFVNDYRVKAVQESFKRGEQETYTLLSIALASGFNSKSTFNRVFKKRTSLAPGQYLSQLQKSSENPVPNPK